MHDRSLRSLSLALITVGAALLAAPNVSRAQRAEPLAIVVNKANPMNEVSLSDLRKIYRGQRGRWSNGRRVTIVMRDAGTPERGAILRSLYGLDERDYRRDFLQSIFSGEANDAPKMLATPNGVLWIVK